MKAIKLKSTLVLTADTDVFVFPDGEELFLKIEIWREIGNNKLSFKVFRNDPVELRKFGSENIFFHTKIWTEDSHLTLIAEKCSASTAEDLLKAVLAAINKHFGY